MNHFTNYNRYKRKKDLKCQNEYSKHRRWFLHKKIKIENGTETWENVEKEHLLLFGQTVPLSVYKKNTDQTSDSTGGVVVKVEPCENHEANSSTSYKQNRSQKKEDRDEKRLCLLKKQFMIKNETETSATVQTTFEEKVPLCALKKDTEQTSDSTIDIKTVQIKTEPGADEEPNYVTSKQDCTTKNVTETSTTVQTTFEDKVPLCALKKDTGQTSSSIININTVQIKTKSCKDEEDNYATNKQNPTYQCIKKKKQGRKSKQRHHMRRGWLRKKKQAVENGSETWENVERGFFKLFGRHIGKKNNQCTSDIDVKSKKEPEVDASVNDLKEQGAVKKYDHILKLIEDMI